MKADYSEVQQKGRKYGGKQTGSMLKIFLAVILYYNISYSPYSQKQGSIYSENTSLWGDISQCYLGEKILKGEEKRGKM